MAVYHHFPAFVQSLMCGLMCVVYYQERSLKKKNPDELKRKKKECALLGITCYLVLF